MPYVSKQSNVLTFFNETKIAYIAFYNSVSHPRSRSQQTAKCSAIAIFATNLTIIMSLIKKAFLFCSEKLVVTHCTIYYKWSERLLSGQFSSLYCNILQCLNTVSCTLQRMDDALPLLNFARWTNENNKLPMVEIYFQAIISSWFGDVNKFEPPNFYLKI